MARAEIDLIVNTVSTSTSRMSAGAGASVQVNVRNADGTSGAAATVYTTATLGTTATNPLTADANGRITGWLDQGIYNFVISGTGITTFTQAWDATPSVGVTAGTGAIGTTQLIDNSVTSAKLASDASVDANRAVQTNHIRDAQITTTKLADNNVTTQKLAASAVSLPKRAVFPSVRLSNSGFQTVPLNTTQALTWDTEGHDTNNMHGNTSPTRITFNTAGVYFITCQAFFISTTFDSVDLVQLLLNGTTFLLKVAASVNQGLACHYLATVGDYVEVAITTQNSFANRTFSTTSSFSAALVSP